MIAQSVLEDLGMLKVKMLPS